MNTMPVRCDNNINKNEGKTLIIEMSRSNLMPTGIGTQLEECFVPSGLVGFVPFTTRLLVSVAM